MEMTSSNGLLTKSSRNIQGMEVVYFILFYFLVLAEHLYPVELFVTQHSTPCSLVPGYGCNMSFLALVATPLLPQQTISLSCHPKKASPPWVAFVRYIVIATRRVTNGSSSEGSMAARWLASSAPFMSTIILRESLDLPGLQPPVL